MLSKGLFLFETKTMRGDPKLKRRNCNKLFMNSRAEFACFLFAQKSFFFFLFFAFDK